MANQKISDLERLVAPEDLSANDLLVVVDTDSKETPSGATKQMTAESLAQAFTRLSAGLIGADFTNLRDTPNEYTLDNAGNFIKVKVEPNVEGQLVGSLEFVDSPGASEQTFSYTGNFESSETFFVGALVRRTATGTFALASSESADKAECVGIIKKIKGDLEEPPRAITIVFGGYIEFTPQTESGIPIITSVTMADASSTTTLDNGVVYFLGKSGRLVTFDPAEQDTEGETHVSKPVLVGTGGMTGIFVNYRGLYHPEDEEANKFTIEREAACSDLKVGDLVRVKGPTDSDLLANKTEYIPSSAEDFETSHIVGMVTLATPDYFEVQTNGMVTFPVPEGLSEKNLENILLIPGTQYYLDTLEEDVENGVYAIRDRLNMYEYANLPQTTIDELTYKEGTPFRNSVSYDPATPLQRTDDGYKVYSRPAFIAISQNRVLLTNHRTLPNPHLECRDCLDHAEMEKSIYWPGSPDVGILTTNSIEDLANTFLTKVWSSAAVGHRATLYKDDLSPARSFRKYTESWKLIEG